MNIRRKLSSLCVVAAAMLLLAPAGHSEVVANLGILDIGDTATTGCTTVSTGDACTSSKGTAGGNLPNSGPFTHQILFKVSSESVTGSSAQLLNKAHYDIDDVSYALYEMAAGPTPGIGGTATAAGAALAIATFSDGPGTTRNFFLAFGNLDPLKTYFLELKGIDGGVTNQAAAYGTITSISAVPLPPAMFLLAAALAGLIGFARFGKKTAKA